MRGVQVLELAGSVAGAFCARMLVTTGADVVLAEPATGSPTRRRAPFVADATGAPRSTVHEYLDAGKRSVVVDLAGRDGDAALAWADVVIVSIDGDPDTAFELRERIRRVSPSTSLVAISGFGLTGPYAHWQTSELVDWASGGYLYVSGEQGRPPLQGAGPWASLLTGATAAVGAAVALLDAGRTGVGQLVDVGNMEAIAAAHQWSITMYTHTGVLKERAGVRFENYHPISIYECSDGWIMIAAPMPERFEDVCIVCEAWDLLLDESLAAPGVRFERADEVDAQLRPWLLAHTVDEAVTALQERRVPTAKLNTYLDVLDAEQLRVRDRWADRPDLGPTARMPRDGFQLQPGPQRSTEPTHPLGADTDAFLAEARAAERAAKPSIDLAGVRVAEFSIAWAGPLAGRFLADFGVDVVKVEHPGSRGVPSAARDRLIGAPGWTWGTPADPQIRAEIFPNADPQQRFWNRSGIWNKMNRGKRSLALEAKVPAGKEILDRLLGDVDVVLHNYSPRGAASLGVDAAGVMPLNPAAITVAMTGYGETGPMAPHFSLGPILEAFGGLDEAMGYIDEGPQRLGIAYPDAVGGVQGTFAVLAALWERAATDQPVHVDLSQLETLVSIVGHDLLAASMTGEIAPRRGNRSLDDAPQGVYRCAGADRWVAITIAGDEQWARLVDLVGDPVLAGWRGLDLDGRRAHHDAIDERIAAWTADRPDREAAACLQAAGIAACPAFTTRDLVEDPHLAARGFIVEWDQVDVGPARFPGYPIHFEHRSYEVRGAPGLGADNAAVLRRLGYTDEDIAQLEADEVVADHPPG